MPDQSEGGVPRIAHSSVNSGVVPISGWEEESFSVPVYRIGEGSLENPKFEPGRHQPIPVEDFPYAGLDSFADRLREALSKGESLTEILEELLAGQLFQAQCEGVRYVLMHIVSEKHWLKATVILCFACGLAEDLGWTQPEAGRRFRITKQAMNQGIKKVREDLGLRKTRMMRSPEAKEKMARSNFRHFKDE